MVPGSGHADFLGYFDWFTDDYFYLLIDLFLPRQAIQVHTCWVLYILLASGIMKRWGTALAGAHKVAAAQRKGESLRSSDTWRVPWQAARSQRKKRHLLTNPDMGETRQSGGLTSTRNSVFLPEVWGLLIWKSSSISCSHHANGANLQQPRYPRPHCTRVWHMLLALECPSHLTQSPSPSIDS